MGARWSDRERAFEVEARAFFAEHLTEEIKRAGSLLTSVYGDPALSLAWQKILHSKGWAAPHWPVEHGGCDWTPLQHMIFARERLAAGAPPLSPMGLNMVAPVIMRYGTPAQQLYFLPRTLSGEIFWCQGYSEPDAGSDLAALSMRAKDDGNDLICNGVKVWTTHAHVADWMFCLVRTAREERLQQGITFLLIDMKSVGVSVRPIIMLAGEHIQSEVHFTDVRVPKANVLGEIGTGWQVAKSLLEFERGGSTGSPILQDSLSRLLRAAGEMLSDDALLRAKIASLKIDVDAFEALELRLMASQAGKRSGAAPSMAKTLFTELSQRITELWLEAAGPYAAPFAPHATSPGGPVPGFMPPNDGFAPGAPWQTIAPLKYLNDRVATIYAGSNEIQRNIMAKQALGL